MFVTLWFAVSFLCAVQRRRGVMLGKELLWPSDAFYVHSVLLYLTNCFCGSSVIIRLLQAFLLLELLAWIVACLR